jgi:hypothetical protein
MCRGAGPAAWRLALRCAQPMSREYSTHEPDSGVDFQVNFGVVPPSLGSARCDLTRVDGTARCCPCTPLGLNLVRSGDVFDLARVDLGKVGWGREGGNLEGWSVFLEEPRDLRARVGQPHLFAHRLLATPTGTGVVRSHVERRCSHLGPTQSRGSPSML